MSNEIATAAAETVAPAVDDTRMQLVDQTREIATAGEFDRIEIAAAYRGENVRGELVRQIPAMVASILAKGFEPSHPVTVSAKPDGTFRILRGHRRHEAAEFIRENHPDDFARIFPDGTMPAVVYRDLTDEQEKLLLVDHGASADRVPLDEWSKFRAIAMLVSIGGQTQSAIAQKLDLMKSNPKTGLLEPNRSYVQVRVNLAGLPKFVQEQFRLLCEEGKEATPVRWDMVAKLYKLYNEEYAHFPDGNGPQFTGFWRECMTAKVATAGGPKPLTSKECLDRSKHIDSPILRETLKLVAGKPAEGVTLADLSDRITVAEAARDTLAELGNAIGRAAFSAVCAVSRGIATNADPSAMLADAAAARDAFDNLYSAIYAQTVAADDSEISGEEIGEETEAATVSGPPAPV